MADFNVQFDNQNDDLQTSFDSATGFNAEFDGLTIGGGGTSDHTRLTNRDAENQHPMSAITGLTNALDDLDDAIGTEASERESADTALGSRIDREESTRSNGIELVLRRIDSEASERAEADDSLYSQINDETVQRTSADTALGSRIDAETTARSSADTAHSAAIGGLGNAIGMRGWNQLVPNGNFADTTGWIGFRCTLSASGNVCRATCNTAGGIYVYRENVVSEYIDGHKYFASAHIKSSATKDFIIATGTTSASKVSLTDIIACQSGVWTEIAGIKTMNKEGHNGNGFAPQSNDSLSVGDYVDIKNTMLIDLTALFGAGNEPSTASEFKAMFPADYYPYCNGIHPDAISNRNLLDNGWFTVNQRQLYSGTTAHGQYTLDRWYTSYGSELGSWAVEPQGIVLMSMGGNVYFMQKFEYPSYLDGKTLTASVMTSTGKIISGTIVRVNGTQQAFFDWTDYYQLLIGPDNIFRIACTGGNSVKFKAVKLELGSVSTLANDIAPDYGEELRKCQRYFVRYGGNGYESEFGFGSSTGNTMYLIGYLPVPMRAKPTISYSGCNIYAYTNQYSYDISGTISAYSYSSNAILLEIHTVQTSIAKEPCLFRITSSGHLDLSADL